MIKNSMPLSMAESLEYVKKDSEASKFVRSFIKLDLKDAKKLREKLENLDLMKLKSPEIAKVIDVMPEDKEDLNKIFVGMSLGEDETKKILDTIKEFK